jgi:hypothetical protein
MVAALCACEQAFVFPVVIDNEWRFVITETTTSSIHSSPSEEIYGVSLMGLELLSTASLRKYCKRSGTSIPFVMVVQYK